MPPLLASTVVHEARDVHPAFDKQSTPDVVALRQLARYQQGLLAAIAETKLDRVRVGQEIPFPLTAFDLGVTLDPFIRVHGATAYTNDSPSIKLPVRIVEYPERLGEQSIGLRMAGRPWPSMDSVFPAAYLEGETFKPLGVADDWTAITKVVVDLFPVGADVMTPNTALILPGQPRRACVADLAAFMAVRAGVSVPDPTGARESYLDEVTERRRAKVGQIAEVY